MTGPRIHPKMCGTMWKVRYTDATTSHVHVCELTEEHGIGGSGEPFNHRCGCGAESSAHFRPVCGAARDSHSCDRIHWHTNSLAHRCHCGHEFRSGLGFNRPLTVRATEFEVPRQQPEGWPRTPLARGVAST